MNDAQKRHVSKVSKTGFYTCAFVSRVLKKFSDVETKRLAMSLLPPSQHACISAGDEHSLKVWAFGPTHFVVEIRYFRVEKINGFDWRAVQYTRIQVTRNDFRVQCIWVKLPRLRANVRPWKQDEYGFWYRGARND